MQFKELYLDPRIVKKIPDRLLEVLSDDFDRCLLNVERDLDPLNNLREHPSTLNPYHLLIRVITAIANDKIGQSEFRDFIKGTRPFHVETYLKDRISKCYYFKRDVYFYEKNYKIEWHFGKIIPIKIED